METTLGNPVQPPLPSDERLAQMRVHLLDEVERIGQKRGSSPRWKPALVVGRRRVLVLIASALAAMFALSAVAAEQGRLPYWTFGSADDPTYPLLQTPRLGSWKAEATTIPPFGFDGPLEPGEAVRVPTIEGASAGKQWKMQAFVGFRGRAYLCYGLSADAPMLVDDEGYFGTCDSRAEWFFTPSSSTTGETHAVQYGVAIPGQVGSGPKYLYGTAASNVARVDLVSDDGTVLTVPTFPVSDDLGVPARLWVAVLRLDHLVHTIVPRDKDGEALERWELEAAL